jgi:hypothetical protein
MTVMMLPDWDFTYEDGEENGGKILRRETEGSKKALLTR